MPRISIISTVYNGKEYLEEYFLSIANQTFKDYELILIDDGSTDGSGDICDEYAKKDSRIKVVHQNNQGLAVARNNGISFTRTEWITFVDCDDAIHPQYLETLYKGVEENKVMLSGVGVLITESFPIRTATDLFTFENDIVDEEFIMGNLCNDFFGQIACAKLINKKILIDNPFTRGRVFEDNAVVKKWIIDAGKITYADNKLYFYRVNNNGLSRGSFNAKKVEDVLWSRDEIISFYKQKGLVKAYSQAEKSYILFAINLYFKLKKVDKESAAKLKKQIIKRYNEDKRSIDFSKKNSLFVFELKHPRLMWLYWKIKGIMKKT